MYTTEERAQRWNAQVRSMSLGAGHNLGRVLKLCDCQDEPCPAMTRVTPPPQLRFSGLAKSSRRALISPRKMAASTQGTTL